MLGRHRISHASEEKYSRKREKFRTKSLKGECVCVAYLKNNKETGVVAERARKIMMGSKK